MLRRKINCIVSVIVLIGFTSTNVSALPQISTVTQENLENSRKQLETNEANIKTLEDAVQSTDNELTSIVISIKDTEDKALLVRKELLAVESDLKKTEELLGIRLRSVYKSGGSSADLIDLILSSNSLSDLVSKVNFSSHLVNIDKENLKLVEEKKEKVETLQSQISKLAEVQSKKKSDLNEKKLRLSEKLDELNKLRTSNLASLEKEESQTVDELIASANLVTSRQEIENIVTLLLGFKESVKTETVKAKIDSAVINLRLRISGITSSSETPPTTNNKVITEAYKYLGIPYLWGGEDPKTGMDCSGFTMYVYKQLGYSITRTTYTQVTQGVEIPVSLDKLQAGDLIFFGDKVAPHHVGLYIGNNMYIHAPHTGDVIKISKGAVLACTARRIIKEDSKN